MTRIDHAAEARAHLAESASGDAAPWDLADKQERWMTDALIASAQVHATLALVEQQRIANAIALFNLGEPDINDLAFDVAKALGVPRGCPRCPASRTGGAPC